MNIVDRSGLRVAPLLFEACTVQGTTSGRRAPPRVRKRRPRDVTTTEASACADVTAAGRTTRDSPICMRRASARCARARRWSSPSRRPRTAAPRPSPSPAPRAPLCRCVGNVDYSEPKPLSSLAVRRIMHQWRQCESVVYAWVTDSERGPERLCKTLHQLTLCVDTCGGRALPGA